ncbi:MAG: tetratricopeptide repeat protein [Bacteroidetes bacterium]|nr:MAG: tetratricopeptide repeat protein [Bacteroidota bacterium]
MRTFTFVLVAALLSGCGRLSEEELWSRVEAAKGGGNWDSTGAVCERILKEYPAGAYAAYARFGLAESHRFRNQPREALDNYKIFSAEHPDLQPAPLSLFLVGYLYNNTFGLKDSAAAQYRLFLERYPGHELAPTVRFELETLGLTPQEALERTERRNQALK